MTFPGLLVDVPIVTYDATKKVKSPAAGSEVGQPVLAGSIGVVPMHPSRGPASVAASLSITGTLFGQEVSAAVTQHEAAAPDPTSSPA
jgi:hypothetical protein